MHGSTTAIGRRPVWANYELGVETILNRSYHRDGKIFVQVRIRLEPPAFAVSSQKLHNIGLPRRFFR